MDHYILFQINNHDDRPDESAIVHVDETLQHIMATDVYRNFEVQLENIDPTIDVRLIWYDITLLVYPINIRGPPVYCSMDCKKNKCYIVN